MEGALAVARRWIEEQPAGTWFQSGAVPGPRHVVRTVLTRLMAAPLPIIGRAAAGIYWRRPPPADHGFWVKPILTPSYKSVLAPAGSGYAEHCALSHVGWSTQVPCRTVIAVPRRNLTPPVIAGAPPVQFVERSNTRRRELNWNEATLLEAVRSVGLSDYRSWKSAMQQLLHATGWMKTSEPIIKERLLWAAETETAADKWHAGEGIRSTRTVLERLASDLPDVLMPA